MINKPICLLPIVISVTNQVCKSVSEAVFRLTLNLKKKQKKSCVATGADEIKYEPRSVCGFNKWQDMTNFSQKQ